MNVGRLSVGMQGPGETITLQIPAPRNVDLAAATEIICRLTVNGSEIGNWSVHSISATSCRATLVPTGNEFSAGPAVLRLTLVVDGTPYRYVPINEVIDP